MNIGGKRIYNKAFGENSDILLWDVFPINNEDVMILSFESKNSDFMQGVWLMCDEGIEVNGTLGKSIMLWYETAPKTVTLKCYTKNGFVNIYNIWDRGHGPNSQSHTSGMIVEETPTGRRYRCNDIGFATNFDKLVFTLEKQVS